MSSDVGYDRFYITAESRGRPDQVDLVHHLQREEDIIQGIDQLILSDIASSRLQYAHALYFYFENLFNSFLVRFHQCNYFLSTPYVLLSSNTPYSLTLSSQVY